MDLESLLYGVADSGPVVWTSDRKRHLSFQAWLIEDREHVVTVEGFELTVEILLLITRVDIGMKTYAVGVV